MDMAFNKWGDLLGFTFIYKETENNPHFQVGFGRERHFDCPYPFDGKSNVLAHAFFPTSVNFKGQLHFDLDENWNIGKDIDLLTVAIHEMGHALGIKHTPVSDSYKDNIMYPSYTGVKTTFGDFDIQNFKLNYQKWIVHPKPKKTLKEWFRLIFTLLFRKR
jgi:hypothetical protein